MMISRCGFNFISRTIMAAFCAATFCCSFNLENNYACAATQQELEQAESNKNVLSDATLDYMCAVAAMSAYTGDLYDTAYSAMEYLGADRQVIYTKNKKADTKFMIINHVDFEGKSDKSDNIICIPGTEKMKDVEVDLRYGSVYFGGSSPEEFTEYANKSLKEFGDNPQVPTVHRGFNDYVQTAFFTKHEETGKMGVDYIFDLLNDEKNDQVYITGHSLGGAAAIILAARLNAMGVPAEKLHVLTFGSPSVGNKAFVDWCRDKFELKRITMKNDVIVGALQDLLGKKKFVQFGDAVEWRRAASVSQNQHSISVYADRAIKNFYDIYLGMPGNINKPAVRYADKNSVWGGDNNNGTGYRVYIAPIEFNLDTKIQEDAKYMGLAVQDILLNHLQGSVAELGEIRDLKETAKAAAKMGCEYAIFESVTATLDKNSQDLYHITIEEGIYDLSGKLVYGQVTNTSSAEITPLEAVMLGIVRGSENRINAVKNSSGLKLGSIFK